MKTKRIKAGSLRKRKKYIKLKKNYQKMQNLGLQKKKRI